MKQKIIAVVLAAVFIAAMTGCAASTPEDRTAVPGNKTVMMGQTYSDHAGVEIQINGVQWSQAGAELEVKWINSSKYDVFYGAAYVIEREIDGEWISCAMKEELFFIEIAYELKGGKEQTEKYNLTQTYDISAPGNYRFRTECFVYTAADETQKCSLRAEFTIAEEQPDTLRINSIFSSPPALKLVSGECSTAVNLGTYCWNYALGDGTWSGVCADHAHPLDSREFVTPIAASEGEAQLEFEAVPDALMIRCWPESAWGNAAAESEPVTVDGLSFRMKPGGYIYEVCAQWEKDGGMYHGTADYYFYAVYDENRGHTQQISEN